MNTPNQSIEALLDRFNEHLDGRTSNLGEHIRILKSHADGEVFPDAEKSLNCVFNYLDDVVRCFEFIFSYLKLGNPPLPRGYQVDMRGDGIWGLCLPLDDEFLLSEDADLNRLASDLADGLLEEFCGHLDEWVGMLKSQDSQAPWIEKAEQIAHRVRDDLGCGGMHLE